MLRVLFLSHLVDRRRESSRPGFSLVGEGLIGTSSLREFMSRGSPPWDTWLIFVQPQVLTRRQFRRCLVIQREFIESLIRDFGVDFRVSFRFALPHSDRCRVRSLWAILRHDFIILEIRVPQTEEDWGSVHRWGRTTLPHGLFQEDNRLTSIQVVHPHP